MISYPIFTHVIDLWEISQYGPTEFYAYEINAAAPGDILPLKHIKDEIGLDAVFATFDEAKAAIMAQVAEVEYRERRRQFFSVMRKPEMRLLRSALKDMKWEHNIEWSTLTELGIEWFGNPNDYDCWMLITDQHLSVCYGPNDATPYFYVSRIHDADDPACKCEFCTVERILAQPTNV